MVLVFNADKISLQKKSTFLKASQLNLEEKKKKEKKKTTYNAQIHTARLRKGKAMNMTGTLILHRKSEV